METLYSFPLISVVVLNYNGQGFLDDCLESVLKSDYNNFELILVDNASTDNSFKSAEMKFGGYPHFKMIQNSENLFFAEGNNRGIKEAKGEYVVVLNNDTVVQPNWLREIAYVMQDKTIGAAQPKILSQKDPSRIDYAGADLDKYGYARGRGYGELDAGQFNKAEQIFYAGGTAMVVRKSIFDEVGFFDAKFGAHWEDVDLSWRIRLRGYKIMFIPKAVVYHKGSQSMSLFVAKYRVAWYVRKNRIAGLIKNYSLFNLVKRLPVLLLIYWLISMKELVFDRSIKLAMSSVLAVIWNIKELPYILRQRKLVQTKIRVVSDAQVVNFMQRSIILTRKIIKE
ncbi:MAG: glycosyltransferase family 2 protein [Candidatus Omnitrophota bacterium]